MLFGKTIGKNGVKVFFHKNKIIVQNHCSSFQIYTVMCSVKIKQKNTFSFYTKIKKRLREIDEEREEWR